MLLRGTPSNVAVSAVNCRKPSSVLRAVRTQDVIASHLEELNWRPYLIPSEDMGVTLAAAADIRPPASDRPYTLLSTRCKVNAGAVGRSEKNRRDPSGTPCCAVRTLQRPDCMIAEL
jgi:hypothetical protein